MQSRMKTPALTIEGAMPALQALSKAADGCGVPHATMGLVHLRASQINGCSVCVDMHPKLMRQAGETDERLFTVAAWRDAPYFTDAERAALALTEAVTRIADVAEPVSDAVWDEAKRHYDEKQLGGLLLAISAINVWNRLNVATKQVAQRNLWSEVRERG